MVRYDKKPIDYIHYIHPATRRPVCVPVTAPATSYSMVNDKTKVDCPICLLYGKGPAIGEKLRVPPRKSRKQMYRVVHN